ncbi:hypothetical protein Tco_1332720 [Tanacetum coccineum]
MNGDTSYIAQDKPTEFALMAYTSNSSGSDIELDQTLREIDDLKAKLEQFKTSSKNLNKLINSQLSAKDKTGLGYGDQLIENDLSGSEVLNSVFDSRSSDGDDNQANDRFKKGDGYHSVPSPLTGNYMPPLADLSFAGLDDSIYRPTANKTSANVSNVEASVSQTSNISVEMPKVDYVRSNEVLIEEWVSDDEDIFQSKDSQTTVKPSFKKIEFTKARNETVKSDKQAEKPRMFTQNPKVNRRDWNGKMNQKLGLVLTRSRKVRVSAAKQSSLRAATSTSALRSVNTATYSNKVNVSKSRTNTFYKSHSPIRMPFYKSIVPNTKISKEKVNDVRVNGVNIVGQTVVSAVEGNGVTAVKASAGCGNPQQALKNKGIFDSGCSRHMTGNKDFLTDYQEYDGGFVSFGGSTRGLKITGKGKIRTNKLDFEDVFFCKGTEV